MSLGGERTPLLLSFITDCLSSPNPEVVSRTTGFISGKLPQYLLDTERRVNAAAGCVVSPDPCTGEGAGTEDAQNRTDVQAILSHGTMPAGGWDDLRKQYNLSKEQVARIIQYLLVSTVPSALKVLSMLDGKRVCSAPIVGYLISVMGVVFQLVRDVTTTSADVAQALGLVWPPTAFVMGLQLPNVSGEQLASLWEEVEQVKGAKLRGVIRSFVQDVCGFSVERVCHLRVDTL